MNPTKQFVVMVACSGHQHYPIAAFGSLDAATDFVAKRAAYISGPKSGAVWNQHGLYVVPVDNEVTA